MDSGSNPTVTCIIATHGRAEMLRASLCSVVDQRRVPDEVIVVDDLADVGTQRVVEQVQANGRVDIRYMPYLKGGGASASRNYGASIATGSLLAFLDDDDLWHSDFLAELVPAIAANGAHMAIGGLAPFKDGLVSDPVVVPPRLRPADVFSSNPGVTGSNFVISRCAFDHVHGFDESLRVSNDKDFFVRVLDGGYLYEVIGRPLAYQRIHETGRLTDSTPARVHALREYRRKWNHRLSRRDAVFLERYILRARYGATPSRIKRAGIALELLMKAGPRALKREYPRAWYPPAEDAPSQIRDVSRPHQSTVEAQ
jgi:glycosyltransferase involved in cell wall biosynthesis